jgi:disulfide bond formation protein DsbB
LSASLSTASPNSPFASHPRQILGLIALACVAMLAYGMYLQHVEGLEPCPMCIVQRYALVLVALVAGVSAFLKRRFLLYAGVIKMGVFAAFGAFVAARQSWLQWNPPEVMSCGRDFFGMIESFPLRRAIPMIFRGTGDCSVIDWTFLGLSIANWSFLCFSAIALLAVALWLKRPTS